MSFSFRKLLIYLLGLGLWSSHLVSAEGFEPLAVRSQSMSQYFRYDPIPSGTTILPLGKVQLRMAHAVANQWGYDKRFIIDGQTQDDWFELNAGLGRAWQLGIGFGTKRVNPSYTDQITIGFHNLFFIPQGERLSIEQNLTRMAIPEYGVEITEVNHGRSWTEHGYLKLTRQLYQQERFKAVAGVMLAQEYSENSLMGQGSQSYGSHIQVSTEFSRLALLSALHFVRHESKNDDAFWLRNSSLSWLMATAFDMQDWKLLSQILIQRGAARDLGQYSRNSYELHLGMRKQWQSFSFEMSLIENIVWHFNSPDWGFTFGLLYHPE